MIKGTINLKINIIFSIKSVSLYKQNIYECIRIGKVNIFFLRGVNYHIYRWFYYMNCCVTCNLIWNCDTCQSVLSWFKSQL